jgi:hypothetical protein
MPNNGLDINSVEPSGCAVSVGYFGMETGEIMALLFI